jgi:hypothetical protein
MLVIVGGCGGSEFTSAAADVVTSGGASEEAGHKSCRLVTGGENTGGISCAATGLLVQGVPVHVLYQCEPEVVLSPACIQPERGQPYWCCKD